MRHALWILFVAGGCALHAQNPNLNFLNNEIAKQIANMEALFGPNTPTSVTGKMGPMPNGGECTIQIKVTDQNTGLSYSYTVPNISDKLCKNYILEQESDGSFKVVPKNDPAQSLQQDLNNLMQLLNFLNGLGGQLRTPGQTARSQEPRVQSGLKPRQASDSGTGFPEVLPLPFAPPLSAGVAVTSSNGCDPGQTYLYFRVNHFDNSVTRYDGCPMQITATIPIEAPGPLQAALTPDNSTLIVTSYNQGITFIDTTTNQVTKTLTTDPSVYPAGIAMRFDGAIAYVVSLIDQNPVVLVLDVQNRQIVGSIPIPVIYPHSVYFSPDGTIALVTCPFANYVYMIDVLTSTVSTAIQILDPRDIAFNPTGTLAYITSGVYPDSIKVVDTATFTIVDSYPVNGYPGLLYLSRDGRDLTVLDLDSTNLFFIDLATRNTVTISTVVAGGAIVGVP
jgi:DNA-binding beta-propeller fold protein YncE